jgi:hypothetical protein
MARYGILKRNIRRNIRPWSEDEVARAKGARAVMAKVVAVFMALSLASAFAPLAANVVFRIPDLYEFDLSRTHVTADIGVDVNGEKVSAAVSQFMRHKSDALAYGVVIDDVETPLFTPHDAVVMGGLRSFLDNILVIGLTCLATFFALYLMLIRMNRPRELRHGFAAGFVLYVALTGFTAAVIVMGGRLMWLWTDVVGGDFTPADMMPRLFRGGFFLTSWAVVTAITLVVMLVLASVTRRLSRRDKMF